MNKHVPPEGTLTPHMVRRAQDTFDALVLGYLNGKMLLKRNNPTFPHLPYMITNVGCHEHEQGVDISNQTYKYKVGFYWSTYDLGKPEFPESK